MKNPPVLHIDSFDSEQKNDNFYVNNIVNHCNEFHNSIVKPHKHDFYVTVLFTAGSGVHEIDFQSYPIQKGAVFMLKPGQIHHWELSEDIDGLIFLHSEAFYDLQYTSKRVSQFPFFLSSINSPNIYLNEEAFITIKKIFRELLLEYNSSQTMKLEKIRSLVDLAYIELSRNYPEEIISKTNKSNLYAFKFQQLQQLIDQNYISEKSPKQYAEWLNMSTKHLNRIVQSQLNKTTQTHITDRVILEAKRLLIQTDAPLSDIAYALGYDDYAHFSRLFKTNCGVSPKEFQSMKNKK